MTDLALKNSDIANAGDKPANDPKFWDKIAQKYAKSPVGDPEAYERTLNATRAHLKAQDHMLELGCGTGTTALILSDQVRHITATDISQNMLDIAKRKQTEQGITNVDFMKKGVEDLPFGETYDVIFGSSLLHLVSDLDGALARILESVEPGGLFISKTVCLKGMNPIFGLILPIMRFFGKAPFVRIISGDELIHAVENAGFEIVETANHNKKSAGQFIVARRPS